jgi:hypothetical protein
MAEAPGKVPDGVRAEAAAKVAVENGVVKADE